MTTAQLNRHTLIWKGMTSRIKSKLTEARLAYLQQVPDNTGFYTKQIKL